MSLMAAKVNTDQYGRSLITEEYVCQKLYMDPTFNFDRIELNDVSKYNDAVDKLYFNWQKLKQIEQLDISVEDFHKANQNNWLMPAEYKNLDIAKWLLDQCKDEVELQRTGMELLMFAERDMLDLLRYLKYLVDTMIQNNIVWGVGRGSSVSSFVLYLIGIHKINSIYYDLDISEFLH